MSKLDDLIARIKLDVAIKRRSDGTVAVTGPKQRAAKEKRETGENVGLRELMRLSRNGATPRFVPVDPYANMTPVGHTPLLQRQLCRCCGNSQINIAAELLHLHGKTPGDVPKSDVWVRRSVNADVQVPHEEPIWAPTQTVTYCYACLVAGTSTETLAPLPNVELDGQLPLFN